MDLVICLRKLFCWCIMIHLVCFMIFNNNNNNKVMLTDAFKVIVNKLYLKSF